MIVNASEIFEASSTSVGESTILLYIWLIAHQTLFVQPSLFHVLPSFSVFLMHFHFLFDAVKMLMIPVAVLE